jgi:hypothetical protein
MKDKKIKLDPKSIELIRQRVNELESKTDSQDESDLDMKEQEISDRISNHLNDPALENNANLGADDDHLEKNWTAIKNRISENEKSTVVPFKSKKPKPKSFSRQVMMGSIVAIAAAAILYLYTNTGENPGTPIYKGPGTENFSCELELRSKSGAGEASEDGITTILPVGEPVLVAAACESEAYAHIVATSPQGTTFLRNRPVGGGKSMLDGVTNSGVEGSFLVYVTLQKIDPNAPAPTNTSELDGQEIVWSDVMYFKRGN